MLTTETDQRLGPSRFRASMLLHRRLRANVVLREALLYDTRYAAAAKRPGVHANLYIILRGAFEVRGTIRATAQAYLLAEEEFERVQPDSPAFRSWGDPSLTIDLRLPVRELRRPIGLAHGPLVLGAPTWALLERLTDTWMTQPSIEHDLVAHISALLARLADDGVVSRTLVDDLATPDPENLVRMWAVLRPLFGQFQTSASLKQIATDAGLSVAQTARDLVQMLRTFELLGPGFRDAIRVTRLRMATLFLSSPGASPSDVAQLVGYGSIDAMGRAFRDAGLPPPSVVQAAVAYDGRPKVSEPSALGDPASPRS